MYPPVITPGSVVYSHCSEDEYEPARALPGRQQAQWSAGFGPAWQLAKVQLQYSDPRLAQQSYPRLWYEAAIEQ